MFAVANPLTDPSFIRKSGVPVRRLIDNIVVIPNNPRVKVGDLVVVARTSVDNVEVIARGSVANIQNNELLIMIESNSIIKFPQKNDIVVSLAKLNQSKEEESSLPPSPELKEDEPDPYEEGYMQLEAGQNQGALSSETTNRANQFKLYDFNYANTRFLWYFDFAWRFGIEYETSGGSVPVIGYDKNPKPTSYSDTTFSFHYRFSPVWRELRPTFKLVNRTSDFKTENEDEYVMSSSGAGLGVGAHFHYLFGSNTFTSNRMLDASVNKLYFEYIYFPGYSFKDAEVSRGESSSGSAYEMNAGMTFLFYVRFIPYFKRYSLDISSGVSQRKFTFTGKPTDPLDIFVPIPEGGSYGEKESYVKIMFGLRLDDFVGKLLKPR